MQIVPIQAIPNQTFIFTVDNNIYDFQLKYTNGVISVSIAINGVDILDNMRAVAGSLIIPFEYLENGNFAFVILNNQLPDYTQFNITQNLIYYSESDLATARTGTPTIITSDYFNPLGALPLRFSPQGY